jgi:peptide/nickel transport system substrate-binding protein
MLIALALAGCRTAPRDPHTVVFLIESSPTNLDPRIGTDAQSEHIDELIFDGLVERDASFNFRPALAASWEQPDPRTIVFHLRAGVHFHDGRPLTARDVAWTINSIKTGKVLSPKAAAYAAVETVEARDALTAIFHLTRPDNFLFTNLSTGAIGIVPEGSGKNFWRHPVGTGPFRFVSQQIDQDVVVERAQSNWRITPQIERVRFRVVPDAITAALELEKGSADVAVNMLPLDSLPSLAAKGNVLVEAGAGTQIQYLGFNLADPQLKDKRIRQAISCSIDRNTIVKTLLGGHAQPAWSLLPASHWAYSGAVPRYDYDPARAERLLDEAGLRPGPDGVRLHLAMKTSTDESTRLLAAVVQQQLARVGIQLAIRSYEYATFYADVTRGAFQMYSLRWIGGNEQPDIFSYAYLSTNFSPKGGNRGHYANPSLDAILNDAAQSSDAERRRQDYAQAQTILAEDLPAIDLWYRDTVVVHSRRLTHLAILPSGSFSFLETARLDTRY